MASAAFIDIKVTFTLEPGSMIIFMAMAFNIFLTVATYLASLKIVWCMEKDYCNFQMELPITELEKVEKCMENA